MDLLQDVVTNGVRQVLAGDAAIIDEFIFEPADPAQDRY
jgi:hypothetical protein